MWIGSCFPWCFSPQGWVYKTVLVPLAHRIGNRPASHSIDPVLQFAPSCGEALVTSPRIFLCRPYPGRLYGAIYLVLVVASLGLDGQADPRLAPHPAMRIAQMPMVHLRSG